VFLGPGSYQYKFVVDDEWRVDPNNTLTAQDSLGGQSSVVVVEGLTVAFVKDHSVAAPAQSGVGSRVVPA
jgi:hypothetical protein